MTTPIHILEAELYDLQRQDMESQMTDNAYGISGRMAIHHELIRVKRGELDKAREKLEREMHYTKDAAQ